MKRLLLIDGDLILFRSCAAVEKEVRWDDENHILFSNKEEAWVAVEHELKQLFDRFETKTTDCIIALTSSPTFRADITQTYKANRAGQRRPLCYSDVRERLEQNYDVRKYPRLEADDVLGIFATRPAKGVKTIVCSIDKDMQTIPCTLWNGKEVRTISQEEADRFHLYQTLVGDTTDGYPGCPGIGPVKAEAILKAPCENFGPWLQVTNAFIKAGLTEEDALRQARLARILRDCDWDSEKKEPILWNPKN